MADLAELKRRNFSRSSKHGPNRQATPLPKQLSNLQLGRSKLMLSVTKREPTSLMLVEELSHRVLNEYTRAIGGLHVAARQTADEMARRQLVDAAERLHAHAHAYRALAMPPADAHFDVSDYIARICSAIAKTHFSKAGLRLQFETNTTLPSDRCWRLALIVCELVLNAARHGHPDVEILVELSATDAELVCRVTNAGACPSDPQLGRGRRVVAALAEELDGRADWRFAPTGVSAWVTLPLGGSFAAHSAPLS